MRILTPAKINPLLYILSKREDGFHELYMHMVPVSLFDTLTFTHNDRGGLNFKMSGADFSEPPEENLVVRAVSIFEQESRETVNLNVILEKKYTFRCWTWRWKWKCGWNYTGFESFIPEIFRS